MPPPPSTQARSNLTAHLTSSGQLSAAQEVICDDIIALGGRVNGPASSGAPIEIKRGRLWRKAFENWDTNSPILLVAPIRDRGADSRTLVGSFKQDLPASLVAKRKAKQASTQTNIVLPPVSPLRRMGANAYMKPVINWDEISVRFHVTDEKNSGANAKYVAYHMGWTAEQAQASAILNWDIAEARRVTSHNDAIIIHWARKRLMQNLRDFPVAELPAGTQNQADQVRPILPIDGRQEDHSRLVQLRGAKQVYHHHTRVAERINSMPAGYAQIRGAF